MAAFVDDTAVYLRRARMTPCLLNRLNVFQLISGLKVQPKKSVFVSLNKVIEQREYGCIPMLRSGDAARYQGCGSSTAPWTGSTGKGGSQL